LIATTNSESVSPNILVWPAATIRELKALAVLAHQRHSEVIDGIAEQRRGSGTRSKAWSLRSSLRNYVSVSSCTVRLNLGVTARGVEPGRSEFFPQSLYIIIEHGIRR